MLWRRRKIPNTPRWKIRSAGSTRFSFIPEVFHTDRGIEIVRNFLVGICGCTGDWSMSDFIDRKIAEIREQVGKSRVILGALRRRRFFCGGRTDPPRDRQTTHLRLRRQWSASQRRARACRVDLYKRNFKIDLRVVDAGSLFSSAAQGNFGARGEAENHWPYFCHGFRTSLKSHWQSRLSGPRYALSRCDRERLHRR